jgi:hypothetical protein
VGKSTLSNPLLTFFLPFTIQTSIHMFMLAMNLFLLMFLFLSVCLPLIGLNYCYWNSKICRWEAIVQYLPVNVKVYYTATFLIQEEAFFMIRSHILYFTVLHNRKSHFYRNGRSGMSVFFSVLQSCYMDITH